MKIYEMAAVTDCDKYYEVEYLTQANSDKFETNKKFLGLSYSANLLIKDALAKDYTIRISSDYKNIDVQPHDLIIIENTLNDLENEKKLYTKKIRQLVTHEQANVSGLMMYQYININNILCDKGFFIHDNNKEEVYLKILETGDEDLIDRLEEYLNARDVISRSSFLENKYQKYFLKMKEVQTIEDVKEQYTEFITKYLNMVN